MLVGEACLYASPCHSLHTAFTMMGRVNMPRVRRKNCHLCVHGCLAEMISPDTRKIMGSEMPSSYPLGFVRVWCCIEANCNQIHEGSCVLDVADAVVGEASNGNKQPR